MEKKKGGKSPTPINSAKRKRSQKAVVKVGHEWDVLLKTIPTLELPEELTDIKVTLRSLEKGAAQRRFLASAAPQMLATLFKSLHYGMRRGNMAATKLTADLYSLTPKNGGISITNVQQNANAGGRRESGDLDTFSFEDAVRKMHESRAQQAIPAASRMVEAPAFVAPTPED